LFFEIFFEKSGTDEFDHRPVRFSPFLLPKAHQVEASREKNIINFFGACSDTLLPLSFLPIPFFSGICIDCRFFSLDGLDLVLAWLQTKQHARADAGRTIAWLTAFSF
jgi:hypothetical protein